MRRSMVARKRTARHFEIAEGRCPDDGRPARRGRGGRCPHGPRAGWVSRQRRRSARGASRLEHQAIHAAVLLEAGKVDAHTALVCQRPLTIAGHRLDCPHPDTAEALGPAAALAYSCNSYFTSAATRLTPVQLRDSFVRAGFSSLTGLAPNEASGVVALAQSPEELQLQAIGEWGISVTPLELVRAYRDLALLSQKNADVKLTALLFEGLQESVSYGMARAAQPALPMKVAGKTGTALA